MSNQAKEAATAAASAGSDVAGTTVEHGRAVAQTAAAEAHEAVDTAKEQTSKVVGEVGAQAREVVDKARTDVRDQANAQTERIAEALRSVAGQVEALVEGRAEDAGSLPDLARQASGQLQSLAGRLGEGGIDGILQETQRFARRRPGLFLAGAAAAGFFGGRLLRGGKAAQGADAGSPAQGSATSAMAPAPSSPQPRMGSATTDGTDVIVLDDQARTQTVLSSMRAGTES